MKKALIFLIFCLCKCSGFSQNQSKSLEPPIKAKSATRLIKSNGLNVDSTHTNGINPIQSISVNYPVEADGSAPIKSKYFSRSKETKSEADAPNWVKEEEMKLPKQNTNVKPPPGKSEGRSKPVDLPEK
jgi:hypothetical protein